MKRILCVIITATLLAMTGCSIGTGIRLTNSLDDDLGWVYIVPADEEMTSGEDVLSGTITPGGYRVFAVDPGVWDVWYGVDGEDLPRGADSDVVVSPGEIAEAIAINN